MILVGLCLAVGTLLAVLGVLFVRRVFASRSNRTFLAVLIWQVALVAALFVWSSTTSRPDLVRSPGWIAICLVAFAVPLAVGTLLDRRKPGGRLLGPGLKVATFVLVGLTIAASVGAVGAAMAPTLTRTTVAGQRVPINADTLQNGYSMSVHIPATSSRFSARNANLWVPPGWILHPDVRRPVVEMMMGQPGDPTLDATLNSLHLLGTDALQSAPFVLVVDQLGGHHLNPPCRNTVAGNVTTYLSVDVPRWIRNNLPVPDARPFWTIAGYSHGGDCAEFLEATYPSIWANMLSVSGPDVPGTPNIPYAIAHYFGGSQAKFDASLTATALKKHGHYSNTVATFATGALDHKYGPGVILVASLADEAGWHVSTLVVPHSGHIGTTLTEGLEFGYHVLFTKGRLPLDGSTPARYLCTVGSSPSDCSGQQVGTLAASIAIIDLLLVMAFFVINIVLYFRSIPKPTV
jgi:hypothetical protein